MRSLSLVLALAQAPAPAPAQPIMKGPVAQAIHDSITRRAAKGFSGAVIVEKDGMLILKAGYGFADRARKVPFTTTTIAQIGSLTKQFTAAAVVDLSAQGRLRLRAKVGEYFPDIKNQLKDISISQLLSHTSGAPDSCGDDFAKLTKADLLGRCGTRFDTTKMGHFAYSNLGYSVLAALVEEGAKRPLEEQLRLRFFDPLGMNDTRYDVPAALRDRRARGYLGNDNAAPIDDQLRSMGNDWWNLKGNGGMQSTAEDMYKWYRAVVHGAPLTIPATTRALRDALMSPHAQRDSTVYYGYGWYLRMTGGGAVEQVSHTGSDGTFFAAIVWRPKEQVFYYLVTNTGDDGGAELASLILRMLRR